MRLIGVELPAGVTSGDVAAIRLDAISVLVGANDSGKTRFLRSIAAGLDAADVARAHEGPPNRLPRFYVELDESPGRWLDEELDVSGRREVPFLPDRRLFGRALTGDKFMLEIEVAHEGRLGELDILDRRLLLL